MIKRELVWPVIDRFINMQDRKSQDVVVRALNLTKDTKAIKYLTKIALSDDLENSQQAIWGIGTIGSPEATETLIKFLREGSESNRISAAQAVYFLPEEDRAKVQKEVIKIVKDPDVSDRMFPALAQVSYLEPFRNILMDINVKPSLKVRAIKSLAAVGSEEFVDIIGISINDSVSDVRLEAVNAIAYIGEENAIPFLVSATKDKQPEIRKAAVKGLAGHIAEPVVSALDAALSDIDEGVRRAAIDTFSFLGEPDENMVSILKNASAQNKDPYVSERARYILKHWGKDK